MSATDDPARKDDDQDVLAAELALGVLSGSERDAALDLAGTNAAFAAQVRAWEDRLHPLGATIVETMPSATARAAIVTRLGLGDVPATTWWSTLALWRGLALASVLLLVAAIALPLLRTDPAVAPALVATLSADGSGVRYAATAEAGGTIVFVLAQGEVLSGRTHEAWLIPAGGEPVSLGVVGEGAARLVVPQHLQAALKDGATLAISDEPVGGSPTGKPTGAVLAAGQLRSL